MCRAFGKKNISPSPQTLDLGDIHISEQSPVNTENAAGGLSWRAGRAPVITASAAPLMIMRDVAQPHMSGPTITEDFNR
jgi:hypothetical protein